MSEFLQSFEAQVVLWTAALAVLLVVGAYLILKARSMREQQPSAAHEMLTDFRELHGRGHLTDEEYRTIKTALTERLEREWTGSGEKG